MIGMQVTTRTGATLTAVRKSHKVRSRFFYVWHCSACSLDEELFPDGSIVRPIFSVTACDPCGCSKRPPYSETQMAIRAKRALEAYGWQFRGWAEPYTDNRTRCVVYCPKHGENRGTQFANIERGSGCPRCRLDARNARNRVPEKVFLERMDRKLATRGYFFSHRVGEYIGQDSIASLVCLEHGEFRCTYTAVDQNSFGCTGCTTNGFSANRPGHLYLLKSEEGAFYKIGVSHCVSRRLTQLKKASPFNLYLAGTWGASGVAVLAQEKAFLKNFESAGFKGFDGATEWLKADQTILSRFSLLPGASATLR